MMVRTSVADTTNITSTAEFAIGRYYSNDYTLDGYISNFRVVKGTAAYTGAFTKPNDTANRYNQYCSLTCRENRFRDASSEGNTVSIGAGTPKINPFHLLRLVQNMIRQLMEGLDISMGLRII